MKTLLSGLVLALLAVGCDQTSPTSQTEQTEIFSEESMLKFAATSDDDPALQMHRGGLHNGPQQARMLEHLTFFLELTDEQRTALEQLGAAMFEELTAVREQVQSGDLAIEDARPLIHDLRTQFMDGVNALLTPEQQAKLDEWQEMRWQKRHHRHGHFGG